MKKRFTVAMLMLSMSMSLAACGNKETATVDTTVASQAAAESTEETTAEKSEAADVSDMTFDELKEAAKGTTVTFYGWGGDEKLNNWLDTTFAPVMKEKYDITMERVPMDIDQILSQLSGEIQGGEEDGSIDMM